LYCVYVNDAKVYFFDKYGLMLMQYRRNREKFKQIEIITTKINNFLLVTNFFFIKSIYKNLQVAQFLRYYNRTKVVYRLNLKRSIISNN